ncbi:MAG: N-6 DNA methylase [Abitibacteriaceae bacterium]|nr:N-6 DNA methylase [Abditibacteriaceae bacterium]
MSLATYIQALRENRAVGVKETSSYGALQSLLDEVGATLKPPVRCILHPQSQGAGIPDGGLFTRDQLQPLGRDFDPNAALQMMPARGVLEVKGTGANLKTLTASAQVQKYLNQYRKVIATNYYQFAVVEQQGAKTRVLETFELAASEAAFWAATNDLNGFVAQHGERCTAFLERALLYGAPLASPEAVATFMASCAREAKLRVEDAAVPALDRVRAALEAALNVAFQGDDATAFFRSSLVQTLFYGVFSAWVLWCRENASGSGTRFDWRLSAHYLRVPVIQSLFYEVSNPQTLQSLNVVEPLDWVADALKGVDRDEFEKRFSDGSAVQYFYEPFLAAFDPELRKQLGVWYTPASVVRYMVARVDEVLKSELGLADGLADERVVVLDPCCGTGAFLVEVIHRIQQTLQARGADALGASDLKSAVLGRLFGFELLTAPFVVAHLQLGLVLQSLGAPLGPNERAQIFLTNALTGWQAPDGEQLKIDLPGLREEQEAAAAVKRKAKILVILGNPPYSGFAGVAIGEERELSEAYRTTLNPALPRPEGQGLNELYVRFFRMAERKITESTGEGVVCFISNYSWLDGKSHTGMREAYLSRFSGLWIDNLNGDRYRTGKVAPDGTPDPSIFSTASNREGIQVGTAIALMVKQPEPSAGASLHFRDLWGTGKHAQLEAETQGSVVTEYAALETPVALGLPFMPTSTGAGYTTWPLLPELFPYSSPGVTTSRDDVVVDIDRERLTARMEAYFNPNVSHEEMTHLSQRVMEDTSGFEAQPTRERLQQRGFLAQNIVRYCYRPFDVRWLYWEPDTKLLDRNRADYWPHVFEGNLHMAAIKASRKGFESPYQTPLLCAYPVIERGANLFPLYLRDTTTQNLFAVGGEVVKKPNLTTEAAAYLTALDAEARTLFLHALAIQHAPRYRHDNADALRLAWPRVPLPATKETLTASGKLGEQVAALLDVLQPVPGVTAGTMRPELRVIGNVTKTGGGELDPAAGELAVKVNWGYRNPQGAIMPGNGRAVERDWTLGERAALEASAAALGLDLPGVLLHLGATAFDVYLNDVAYWSGIPARVWSYTMGGYRVLKKWLSYRETAVLGRDLTPAEVREAQGIVRRIAALLLLEPSLDANYAACSAVTVELGACAGH